MCIFSTIQGKIDVCFGKVRARQLESIKGYYQGHSFSHNLCALQQTKETAQESDKCSWKPQKREMDVSDALTNRALFP
jgi:hypothetical protein